MICHPFFLSYQEVTGNTENRIFSNNAVFSPIESKRSTLKRKVPPPPELGGLRLTAANNLLNFTVFLTGKTNVRIRHG